MPLNNNQAAPHIIAAQCARFGMPMTDVSYALPGMSEERALDLSGNGHHLTTVSATPPSSEVTVHGRAARTIHANNSFFKSTTEFPPRFAGITDNWTMMVSIILNNHAAHTQQFSFALGSGRGIGIGPRANSTAWGVVRMGIGYISTNLVLSNGPPYTLICTRRDGTMYFFANGIKDANTSTQAPNSFDDTIHLCAAEPGRWWSSAFVIEAHAWADPMTDQQAIAISQEPCLLLQPQREAYLWGLSAAGGDPEDGLVRGKLLRGGLLTGGRMVG